MFAILVLLLSSSYAFAQREIVFLTSEKEGIKGNVKEVKVYECEIDYENHLVLKDKKKLCSITNYNDKGFIDNQIHYIGQRQSNRSYHYGCLGKKISTIDICSYDIEDDKRGNVKKIRVEYEYNKEGKVHQIVAVDAFLNEMVYSRYFHYTSNGNVFIDDFEGDRSPLLSGQYAKDDDHPMFLYMNRGESIIRHSYVYNDSRQMTADKIMNKNGGWDIYRTFEYDEKGNVIKETKYRGGGTILNESNYSYKYDNKGNWIEKETKYSDIGFATECKIREITYYK